MLELCVNSDRLSLSTQPLSTPVAPSDDACRAAHEALKCIACARPAATVIALSTEVYLTLSSSLHVTHLQVARYNAAAHSQTIQHVASASAIARARHEVIKLIELLAEQRAVDIAELMVPVSICALSFRDSTKLLVVRCHRTHTRYDSAEGAHTAGSVAMSCQVSEECVFSAITRNAIRCRFRMIDYNSSSKRLIAGGKNGTVVIHELRANKAQVRNGLSAHL